MRDFLVAQIVADLLLEYGTPRIDLSLEDPLEKGKDNL